MLDRNFISAVETDGKVYWVTERLGFFMRLDPRSLRIEYMHFDYGNPNHPSYGNGLIAAEGDIIYGISECGRFLRIFNLNDMTCKTLEIDLQQYFAHDFAYGAIFGDDIILLLYQYPCMIRINKKTGDVRFDESIKGGSGELSFAACHLISDDLLWVIRKEEIKSLNIKTGDIKTYPCTGIEYDPLYFQVEDNVIYILDDRGNVYLWKEENGQCNRIYEDEINSGKKYPYFNICVKNNKLYLLPLLSEKIIRMDMTSGSIEEFRDYPKGFYYLDLKEMSPYGRALKTGKKTIFSMHTGTYIFSIDENGNGAFLEAEWPDEIEETREYISYNGIISEGTISLNNFIKAI